MHLLFLLANNPTGHDGFIEDTKMKLSSKKYLTKQEAEQKHREYVEEQIRELQDKVYKRKKLGDGRGADVDMDSEELLSEESPVDINDEESDFSTDSLDDLEHLDQGAKHQDSDQVFVSKTKEEIMHESEEKSGKVEIRGG